jgi:hypothetical protein
MVHPLPKYRERNMEQSVSIRFLDTEKTCVNFSSATWEQTTITGHKDNIALYSYKKTATYIIPASNVLRILAEEIAINPNVPEVEGWYAWFTVIGKKDDGTYDPELYPLDFNISLARIMKKLSDNGVLQYSEEFDCLTPRNSTNAYRNTSSPLSLSQSEGAAPISRPATNHPPAPQPPVIAHPLMTSE